DPLNNIASRTGNSTTVTYSYDATNRLTGLSDGTTFGYDPRGNVVNKNGVVLGFDAKNQLQNVGGSVAYAYDASGRRVSKTPSSGGATYYFYSQAGQLMYQWEPGNAKATDYVYLGKRMLARNETYNTQVTGNIDGVNIDGSGNATINGWACSTHLNQSIGVEVFAGGASGAGGVRITTATANVASEPAVASACQASGSNYRFKVPLTDAMRSQYGGQVLYMYGDSPVGVGNLVLAHSGSFTMPVARVSGAPTITSPTTGSSNTTGAYTVAWSSVTGATSYTLQEQVNGGSWSTVQSSSAASLAVSGKGNGTYGYRVQACNSSGCGAWSTTVTTTVLLPPPAPGTITVPATSSGSIAVSWAASSTATSYTLQQSLNGGAWSNAYTGAATSTTRTVTATGSYTFQVQACNASGCGAWKASAAVAVTIPPASAPTLTVPSSSANGSYTVSWTGVSGATSYALQEQVNGGAWTTIQATSATSRAISGKGNGTYGYHVQACNVGGCGAWSGTANVVVLLPPEAPGSISVPATSSGSITVSWAASSTATSYTLQQSRNEGGWSTVYSGAAISATLGVGASGSYTYQVQACNGGGCSGWRASGAVAVTIPPGSAPTLTVPASNTTGSYTVSWTGVSGATSYTLQEQVNGGGWSTIQATGATSKAISGKGNSTYGYRVQACNAGGCGAWSATKSNTVLLPPATPTGLHATVSGPSYKPTVALSWSGVTGATSYTVEMNHPQDGIENFYVGPNTSASALILADGQVSFHVKACNASGCSGWSSYAYVNLVSGL
ncbi:MAG: chitinase N-terminal domain-containing protein, partial [Dyella sp.]|uniref:chitinase N-terminal domain-containing protein n=1 Tax=Dyella sp. TaxID=1869338 RepID=UPI003F7F5320